MRRRERRPHDEMLSSIDQYSGIAVRHFLATSKPGTLVVPWRVFAWEESFRRELPLYTWWSVHKYKNTFLLLYVLWGTWIISHITHGFDILKHLLLAQVLCLCSGLWGLFTLLRGSTAVEDWNNTTMRRNTRHLMQAKGSHTLSSADAWGRRCATVRYSALLTGCWLLESQIWCLLTKGIFYFWQAEGQWMPCRILEVLTLLVVCPAPKGS